MYTNLTPREREVLGLLDEGASLVEIARALSLDPATVEVHLDSIYVKAGVDRMHANDTVASRLWRLEGERRELARLLLEGHTNHTIARRLYLSPEAVRIRLNRLYEELGAHNRYEAIAAIARRHPRSLSPPLP